MPIYRGPGGSGDATADSASEALLIRDLAIEVQADADAAATSATNAANSATAAATSATNASNSASAAATSATNAANSASTATTQASNAATSATAAQTAETNAELAETNAETAQTAAELAETNAETAAATATTQAGIATTQASNASTSASAAAASAASAAASFDAFDDIYLGAKASNPTVDNDGNALTTGDQYFNTVSNELRVWNGSTWQAASVIGGTVNSLDVTGVATFSAGTVSAPAITTTGDTNTGIFFPAADTIAFTEGGIESMRIDSAGNVGIGKTNPSSKLDIETGGNGVQIRASAANAYIQLVPVYGTGASYIEFTASGSSAQDARISSGNGSTSNLIFQTGGASLAERMRIDSSGNCGIGTSSPSTYGKFAVVGASANRGFYADANAQPVARYDDNSFINNGFTLRNTGLSGSNQGIGILFQLGTGGTAVDSGAIQMRSEADYSTSANQDAAMTFSTVLNGTNTERMRIDSAGNVGIGTSSPSTTLDVNGAGNFNGSLTIASNFIVPSGVTIYNTSGDLYLRAGTSGALRFGSGNTNDRMILDSSGNVGIGTSSPSGASGRNLTIYNSSGQSRLALKNSVTGDGANDGFQVGIDGDGMALVEQRENLALMFATNATERMRIDSSGNLLVGTTSSQLGRVSSAGISGEYSFSSAPASNGGEYYHVLFRAAGTQAGFIYSPTTSTTSYITTSDYRLKENIAPMTGALAKVAQLNPVTYKWKTDGVEGQGFIAHELQAVVPDCVVGQKDALNKQGNPEYQGIDTSFLVATLTAAIQEQQAIIENLTTRLNALEGK